MSRPKEEEEGARPHIAVSAQYIKDLSFENPGAPETLKEGADNPKVDLSLDVGVAKLPEEDFYEVSIQVHSKASLEGKTLFEVELVYAGVFSLIDVEEEHKELLLSVHCPATIFPFARKILADVTQDGGFRPLMLDPIDFGALYYKKRSEQN